MTDTDSSPEALLPWYVNGSLDAAERRRVDAWLAESDTGRAQLAALRQLQQSLRDEAQPAAPTELGWRRLQKTIQQQRQPDRAPGAVPRRFALWQSLAAGLFGLVIGLQAVYWQGGADDSRLLSGPATESAPARQWVLQVRFDQAATAAQINAALLAMDAAVIDGPSAIGLYRIAVDPALGAYDSAEAAARWLRDQAVTAEVQVQRRGE